MSPQRGGGPLQSSEGVASRDLKHHNQRMHKNTSSRAFARLQRTSMTREEVLVWSIIRKQQLGVRFRRQLPIGPYFAAFACLSPKLIVEVDGGHHGDEKDKRRDAYMRQKGWHVVRLWNNEVRSNLDGVQARLQPTLDSLRAQNPLAAARQSP